jgi:hypothetical protein
MGEKSLAGRKALVTGGARGIGAECDLAEVQVPAAPSSISPRSRPRSHSRPLLGTPAPNRLLTA